MSLNLGTFCAAVQRSLALRRGLELERARVAAGIIAKRQQSANTEQTWQTDKARRQAAAAEVERIAAERAEREERQEQERLDFIAATMARQQARLSRL